MGYKQLYGNQDKRRLYVLAPAVPVKRTTILWTRDKLKKAIKEINKELQRKENQKKNEDKETKKSQKKKQDKGTIDLT
jgi:hypothetical protein